MALSRNLDESNLDQGINNILAVDDNAEESITVTAADVLKKLEEAWVNEKLSPDILEHQGDVVDCMLEQIEEMEENLKRLKKGDFRISIHRLEIERVKYMLCSYLRTRLSKIENFCGEILAAEKDDLASGKTPRLSTEELQFAKSYFSTIQEHLKNVCLKNMPVNMQSFDARQATSKPDLNSYVFLRANETAQGVLLREDGDDRDEVIDMEKGSQHLLPYKSILHLLKQGLVSLI